ncbi:hypothetical protein DFH94DRAFT_386262 [Russula ochroleuca]|jgi:hypothetical protein|uniref:Uncharacterized protein n=1 Tax=Russula ochroleuca TaxID=152965 RepID=A0A9P5N0E3_9AGAM|nr:hypothetical protein DFH94DRAFT_386262 [Russula ochroleuca]
MSYTQVPFMLQHFVIITLLQVPCAYQFHLYYLAYGGVFHVILYTQHAFMSQPYDSLCMPSRKPSAAPAGWQLHHHNTLCLALTVSYENLGHSMASLPRTLRYYALSGHSHTWATPRVNPHAASRVHSASVSTVYAHNASRPSTYIS